MADSERRYGPTIDLQGFDLRTDMDTVDEPSRLPLLVVIALVVLAAFAGVVWLAYTQGVERGRESVSRELVAQALWKVHKPEGPAYTGLKIYESPTAAVESASAKPSVPVKRQAANAIPALRPTASATPDVPLPETKINSSPGTAAAPAVHPLPSGKAGGTAAVPGTLPQRVATRAPTDLTKSAAAPPMASHPITAPDSLPPTSPSKTSIAPPSPTPTSSPKTTVEPASAPPPAAASTPAPKSASASGMTGVVLQIGSYKSEAEARQSWNAFKAEHSAAAPYRPDVKQADLGAKGTWFRLRIGPFADKRAALETCAKLKADGASCLLTQ